MDRPLPPLNRILAIHDLSGVGKCSLTVALPVISAAGVECACMPTAVLSTHSGEFYGFTKRDLSGDMLPMAEHWRREGIHFDGIYTGYLASPAQVELLERVIDLLAGPECRLIVDPVMADNGKYYAGFDDRMRDAFRRLCARADVITPNLTEAALLTGLPYQPGNSGRENAETLLHALADLGAKAVTLTGVHLRAGEVGNAALDTATGEIYFAMRPARPGIFYGTGDLFASALAALLVRRVPLDKALEIATALVDESISRSVIRGGDRRLGVDFEGALPGFIRRTAALLESDF